MNAMNPSFGIIHCWDSFSTHPSLRGAQTVAAPPGGYLELAAVQHHRAELDRPYPAWGDGGIEASATGGDALYSRRTYRREIAIT
jgi:hypothetical protein